MSSSETNSLSSQSPFTQGLGTVAQESMRIPSMSTYNNLVSFLAVAQYFGFDFLHIQWDPDLDPVGLGANAEVRTKFLSDRREFAFKRHRALESLPDIKKLDGGSSGLDFYTNKRQQIFNELVSEVTILGHPSIRHHPNFVHIEGICWEIASSDTEMWPILVLEKANLGDLWHFGKSPQGRQLTTTDRLLICQDIANALLTLHENGMIHGDVKPQNVLMVQETTKTGEEGLIYPKLGDFGSAGWDMGRVSRLLLYPPRSRPWDAPEYHHRGFDIEQAKALDVYSFGLLCFWLLFHDKSLRGDVAFPDCIKERGTPAFKWQENVSAWLNEMEQLKRTGLLVSLMCEFVQVEVSLNDKSKNLLEQFFRHALARDPQQRKICVGHLSTITGQECVVGPQSRDLEGRNLDHALVKFRVASSYISLMHSSHKVIQHIASSLRLDALYGSHKSSRENAAFQYAVCCKTGFGTPANEDEAQNWLRASERTGQDLADELVVIRRNLKYQSTYRDGDLLQMSAFGSLLLHPRWYDGDEKTMMRELSDIVNCFGTDNTLVQDLRLGLARFLLRAKKFDDAERELISLLKDRASNPTWISLVKVNPYLRESNSGWRRRLGEATGSLVLRPPKLESCSPELRSILPLIGDSKWSGIGDLADIYVARQRWSDAEMLLVSARDTLLAEMPEYEYSVLQHTAKLGSFYVKAQRYSDAEHVFMYVSKAAEFKFGKQHPDAIDYQEWLAYIYLLSENYPAAEAAWLQIRLQLTRIYGASNVKVRKCNLQLSHVYRSMQRYQEAESIASEMILNPKEHESLDSETIEAMLSLGLVLAQQDSFDKSEKLLRQVLDHKSGLASGDDYIDIRANLGAVLRRKGNLVEAESVLSSAVLHKHPVPESRAFVLAVVELSEIYESQGRYKEYEQLYEARLMAHTNVFGRYHITTVRWIEPLVQFYMRRGRLREAERLQLDIRQTLDLSPDAKRANNLQCDRSLCNIYCWQGRFDEADLLISDKIEEIEHVFGVGSKQWRSVLYDLMLIRKSQSRWTEANAASLKYLVAYRGRAKKDPWRTIVNGHRASILVRQHRFREAAPFVLGSPSWPNAYWTNKFGFFEVCEVDGGLYPVQYGTFMHSALQILALILFFGYWSGLYFISCTVVQTIVSYSRKRTGSQKILHDSELYPNDRIDRPSSFSRALGILGAISLTQYSAMTLVLLTSLTWIQGSRRVDQG